MTWHRIYSRFLSIVGNISLFICVIFMILNVIQNGFQIDVRSYFNPKLDNNIGFLAVVSGLDTDCHLSKFWKLNRFNISPPLSLYRWGSYRPDIYFGLKTKTITESLATGIFWNSDNILKFRHSTNDVDLSKLYWKRHNGRNYGEEILNDAENDLSISASFIVNEGSNMKNDFLKSSWIQRLKLSSISNVYPTKSRSNLYFYLGIECSDRSQQKQCVTLSSININYVHRHTPASTSDSMNRKILSIGGYSKHSGKFLLQLSMRMTDDFDKSCDEGNTCDIESANSFTYFTSNDKNDVWSEIRKLEDDIKSFKSRTHYDSKNDFLNSLATTSTFIAFKASSPRLFTLDCNFYENMEFQNQKDFETLSLQFSQASISADITTKQLQDSFSEFNDHFDEVFSLKTKSFKTVNSSTNEITNAVQNFNDEEIEIAKVSLSSVLGGIGYFSGIPEIGDAAENEKGEMDAADSLVDRKSIELITATPSRTIFPRGFLWDEGFHQLLISEWDWRLSLTVITYWLNAMYVYDGPKSSFCEGGWIPREMILGDVARSRVPREFITQRVNIANPPTFLLVIDKIIKKYYVIESKMLSKNSSSRLKQSLKQQMTEMKKTLSDLYPALDMWITWFLRSQRGTNDTSLPGSFRWRGRSIKDNKVVPNTLSSGLDDYPRSSIPSENEAHVDLHAWMINASKMMISLCKFLDNTTIEKYAQIYNYYMNSLNILHWTNATNTQALLAGYYDVGLHHEHNRFELFTIFRCGTLDQTSVVDVQVPVNYVKQNLQFCPETHPKPLFPHKDEFGQVRVFENYLIAPEDKMSIQFIPRVGYVNIFPFILQVIPPTDNARIQAMLDMISNPEILWSNYGLRSISKTDIFYKKRNSAGDKPYWRGPIWININYLALKALYYYKSVDGMHQKRCDVIYHRLRTNVINTILNSMKKTSFLWEQYDDVTGEGISGRPFTGWTTLITNIMGELY